MITILIVHPHRLIREVWTVFFSTRPGMTVVGATDSIAEGHALVKHSNPRVTVIAGELTLALYSSDFRNMAAGDRTTRLILVTGDEHDNLHGYLSAIRLYAVVAKHSTLNELERTVRKVDAGLRLTAQEVMTAPARLTKREADILQLVASGKTSREIAAILKTSFRTIDVHRSNLLKKMECKNTSELLNKFFVK